MAPGNDGGPMLLDRLMPACDASRVEHRVVAGEPAAVYEVALNADFLDAVRRNRGVGTVFALRSAAEHLVAVLRGRPPSEPAPAETLRLSDMTGSGDWVLLGAEPPSEIAFGAVGRFWSGETRWEQIDAPRFSSFDREGFARIACSLSFRPYGEHATLVSYEVRTQATDPASRRAFLRYWRVVSPGVGLVMRSLLKLIAQDCAGRTS